MQHLADISADIPASLQPGQGIDAVANQFAWRKTKLQIRQRFIHPVAYAIDLGFYFFRGSHLWILMAYLMCSFTTSALRCTERTVRDGVGCFPSNFFRPADSSIQPMNRTTTPTRNGASHCACSSGSTFAIKPTAANRINRKPPNNTAPANATEPMPVPTADIFSEISAFANSASSRSSVAESRHRSEISPTKGRLWCSRVADPKLSIARSFAVGRVNGYRCRAQVAAQHHRNMRAVDFSCVGWRLHSPCAVAVMSKSQGLIESRAANTGHCCSRGPVSE